MTNRQSPLRLEELGERVLPSMAPMILTPLPIVPLPAPIVSHDALAGHGLGTFAGQEVVPDVGQTFHFQGTADLATVGHVAVSGQVGSVGFIMMGHATGTLTLSNTRGSVTISFTGPAQPGFSALPHHFAYRVIGGTGAYAHFTAHGTLYLALFPAAGGTFAHGAFRMAF
jgi:hypothetical protein